MGNAPTTNKLTKAAIIGIVVAVIIVLLIIGGSVGIYEAGGQGYIPGIRPFYHKRFDNLDLCSAPEEYGCYHNNEYIQTGNFIQEQNKCKEGYGMVPECSVETYRTGVGIRNKHTRAVCCPLSYFPITSEKPTYCSLLQDQCEEPKKGKKPYKNYDQMRVNDCNVWCSLEETRIGLVQN